MTRLSHWLEDIGLLLNTAKTQVLFIRPRGNFAAPPSTVICRDQILEVTKVAKYLGVFIDDELTWKPHIDHLAKKCSVTTGQLWRHGRCLSLRARRLWYTSMIISHLCYASNCFFPSLKKSLLQRLIRMSKARIRAVFQAPRRSSTGPLLERLSLPTLHHIYAEKLLVFVFRTLHSRISSQFQTYFSLLGPLRTPALLERVVTRGQVHNLVRVPFVPNPAGRASMQFLGSVVWNALPDSVRSNGDLTSFKCSISKLDLEALVLHT